MSKSQVQFVNKPANMLLAYHDGSLVAVIHHTGGPIGQAVATVYSPNGTVLSHHTYWQGRSGLSHAKQRVQWGVDNPGAWAADLASKCGVAATDLRPGVRVVLGAVADLGLGEETAEIVETTQMPWGLSLVVRVDPQYYMDKTDDGLREVTAAAIVRLAPRPR